MTLEEAALWKGWARRSTNGGLVWIESEIDVREIWETATAAERERCAKLCEQQISGYHSIEVLCNDVPCEAEEIGEIKMSRQCAEAIRAEQPPR